jgi:hypothetical protein
MRLLLNEMRALMDKKRRLMNKMRALMDKNGVVMERFERFRVWEFIRVHLRQKVQRAKMFRIVPLSGFRESCKVCCDKE